MRRHRGGPGERGAAALEFGLVVPLLLTVLLGTLQYGLYFFDSIGARAGVREAARQGVVKTFEACGDQATDLARFTCAVEDRVGAVTGPTYVKVAYPEGWERGRPLVVCAMVQSDGGIGLLPMPDGGLITAKTEMSIEKDGAPSGVLDPDDPPPGADWAWCA